MGARMTIRPDNITVHIFDKLSYSGWETLRDARNAALAAKLPLRIEVDDCVKADIGGIGSILIAQDQLHDIEICGCSPLFAECFRVFGVCRHCTNNQVEPCRSRALGIRPPPKQAA